MIEVEGLTKFYGPSPAVLDVSFQVQPGEILGFLGPNGAGKTTTMRMLTGYLPPTGGTARVAGFDIGEDSADVRRHVGYLPETVPLYTDITPYDYLDFMGKIKGLRDGRARKERIWEVMEQVRIEDVAGKLIGRLSKGYRQRVGLAQALISNPSVLILDEPTVGLDPRQIIEVRELIKNLAENHTVILSTHILPEVSMVCSRVVIINKGRLAVDMPTDMDEALRDEPQRVQITVRGPQERVTTALLGVPGVTELTPPPSSAFEVQATDPNIVTLEVVSEPENDLRAQLAATVIGAGWELLDLHAVRLSLEDIFLRVTTTEEEAEAQPDDAEYFEPGEEDDLTESEELELYEDGAETGQLDDYVEEEPEEEIGEEAPPPPPARPVRPPVRQKGGRP